MILLIMLLKFLFFSLEIIHFYTSQVRSNEMPLQSMTNAGFKTADALILLD